MDAFNEYFLDVVKYHYADFNGRSSRKQYWMFVLFQILFLVAILIVAGIVGSVSETLGGIIFLLYYVVALGLLLPGLGIAVRRLHDTGKTGWLVLIGLIPLIGLVLLYFMILEGDAGPNEYGPDPLDPYADDLADPLNI